MAETEDERTFEVEVLLTVKLAGDEEAAFKEADAIMSRAWRPTAAGTSRQVALRDARRLRGGCHQGHPRLN